MVDGNHTRFILGGLINIEIWIFLGVNMLCLTCIYRGRLYANKDNPVYVISGLNILVETIQLFLHMVYIGPMIFIGDWLFESRDSIYVTMISYVFLLLWFTGSVTQIAMAINRLCVVCISSWKLTRNHMLIAFLISLLLAIAINTYSEVLAHCCKITPDFNYYGYSYKPVVNITRNYSLEYSDFNFDLFTSVFCGFSYLIVFRYIKKMGRQGDILLKKREIRLCIQFLAVFLAYTVAWMTFFVLPEFGVTEPAAYAITSMSLICNCGINALVYLFMNNDVKNELCRMFGVRRNVVDSCNSNEQPRPSHPVVTDGTGTATS